MKTPVMRPSGKVKMKAKVCGPMSNLMSSKSYIQLRPMAEALVSKMQF